MNLIVNKEYKFNFAGQILTGKFIKKDKLHDGTTIYMFNSEKYKYPVRMKNIIKTK